MFWVELTDDETGKRKLVNMAAAQGIWPCADGTLIRFVSGWEMMARETPAQIEALLPFVRRVGQQGQTEGAFAELLAAAEEAANTLAGWEIEYENARTAGQHSDSLIRLRAAIAAARERMVDEIGRDTPERRYLRHTLEVARDAPVREVEPDA